MGYTTEFKGSFTLSRPLTVPEFNKLKELAASEDWKDATSDVPNSYLQWVPTKDGNGLEWDGDEKFYYYAEWLQWLIDNPLKEWGIEVSGSVAYEGKNRQDRGDLIIKDGKAVRQAWVFAPMQVTPEDFAKKMATFEQAGKKADAVDLVSAVLAGLGYQDGISIFRQIDLFE